MPRIFPVRSSRARWIVWLPCLLCCAAVAVVGGCSSASSIFPNNYKLLRSARAISNAAQRYAPIPRELEKRALLPYFVQPGDVLLLEVVDLESDIRLPVDQTVMPDGTIDLGQYGRLVVAGLTIEEIEQLVLTTVRIVEKDDTIEPINVRLSLAESAQYYVLGEVNSPGAYSLIGRETALDGLMAAGGLSDQASEHKIILSRPTPPGSCRVVLPICYNHIVQLGDTTTNYQLQPGDRIYVGSRTFCESLRFWQTGSPTCPDCSTSGCPDPCVPIAPPFIVSPDPTVSGPELLIAPPGTELAPVDAELAPLDNGRAERERRVGAPAGLVQPPAVDATPKELPKPEPLPRGR